MKAIIIDDEAVAAAAMKRRIPWENYDIQEVFVAHSMRQAIQIMEETAVELMLCDVEMPGGSGLELYEWVRTYRPETECIFVSCHPEYEYVRKALTMGSMDYILKPVDYDEMGKLLAEAQKRILHRRKADAEVHEVTPEPVSVKVMTTSLTVDSNALGQGSTDLQGAPMVSMGAALAPETAGIMEYDSSGRAIFDQETDQSHLRSDAVTQGVQYIREHLRENMSISDIADAVHLNPQYFMRLFKKETGRAVLEFITECRLTCARKMLKETNLPITEVALESGYDNFSYFSKLFKKYEGMSPSEYRRRI